MNVKPVLCYLSLLLLSAGVYAQTTPTALSVREAIACAEQNNRQIKISRYEEAVSRQVTNEVKGRGLPQLNQNRSLEDWLKLSQLVIPGGFPGTGGSAGNAEGIGTSNNVVEAETGLRQAQNTYVTTLLNLYTARLDLERAKGTLLTYLNSK